VSGNAARFSADPATGGARTCGIVFFIADINFRFGSKWIARGLASARHVRPRRRQPKIHDNKTD
jgi:hypothetical protein